MKISHVADKFAMKLGLESRPAPSATPTETFDYTKDFDVTEPVSDFDVESEDKPSPQEFFPHVSDQSLPLGYKSDMSSTAIRHLLNALRARFSGLATTIPMGDYNEALEVVSEIYEQLDALQVYLIKKIEDAQVKSASSYMYEPEEYSETDDDRDFESYWDYFLGELDFMDEDELYKEERKLKQQAISSFMDEEDVPSLLMSKLKEVRKRMKKSTDESSIMADIMADANSAMNFVE